MNVILWGILLPFGVSSICLLILYFNTKDVGALLKGVIITAYLILTILLIFLISHVHSTNTEMITQTEEPTHITVKISSHKL
ncbi:hypothetical protein AN639_02950 [Candidatus Epulonipiscium fishelsonii]|uniref:Uncharacterized protein n=1 Tax=Candidatus Epulonipiscium fishelsonii TaxID=77094 RepID=A0ACC8XCI6_9FIRM|nr:hypothetical protein AN396_05640 [Epulopiscium sp. SCG-B11WGA-EpuloA1]ONI41787.1 hypothetical protein AN639_02950 [Epulopiscium sp. SCG-B05WGA-EpuloA1]